MTQLPTNRTAASTVQEHVDDHNTLAIEHNELDGHAAATTTVHGIANTAALYLAASHTKAAHDALALSHDSLADVSIDDHHARDHTLSGSTHTASGLSTGNVIRASGATTFAWAQLGHGDLGSVSADQHHAQAHHAAHEPSGADPMAVDAAAATGSLRTLGTGAAQAATGNHAHSGTYEPVATAHHARHDAGGADAMVIDAAVGTGSLRTLGTGAAQAAAGDHTHAASADPSFQRFAWR